MTNNVSPQHLESLVLPQAFCKLQGTHGADVCPTQTVFFVGKGRERGLGGGITAKKTASITDVNKSCSKQ